MNSTRDESIAGASGSSSFEETLRLIARLAPPEGLEERVQAGLKAAPASSGARILAWPVEKRIEGFWMGSSWMRSAAAAAIVAVVIGGSWSIYSRVQSIQPVRAVTVPLHFYSQGGFSSAGAMRTPQTLNGPIVTHPALAAPRPSLHPAAKTGKAVGPSTMPPAR
jgi:hypothetical protein